MPWTAYAEPNITGLYDTMVYANTVTDNLFGTGLVLSMFSIFFILFRRWGTERALAASSFMTLALSLVLSSVGLVDGEIIIVMAVASGISGLLLMVKK